MAEKSISIQLSSKNLTVSKSYEKSLKTPFLIKGFLGIGSAPEFLENLMWKKFTKKMKKEIKTKGIITIKHGRSSFKNKLNEYPITFQLIKDGRKNKILIEKIKKNTLKNIIIQPIDEYGINGDFVESQAFAFLAIRSILKLPISFPNNFSFA